MDVSNRELRTRKLLITLVLIILLLSSFLLLLIVGAFQKQGKMTCERYDYTMDEFANITPEEEQCFCNVASKIKIATDTPEGLKEMCYETLFNYIKGLCSMLGGAIVVLNINMAMKMTLWKMQAFQRSKTQSDENYYQLAATVIFLSVNVGFVPFISMWRFHYEDEDFIPAKMFTGWVPFIGTTLIKGDPGFYSVDFNQKWYVDTGGKFSTFFILQIFVPQIFLAQFPWLWKLIRNYKLKKVTTQKDANIACTGPLFKLTQRNAEALALMLVAFTFSTCMPHLLLFAGFVMLSRLVCDKYTTSRLYSRPDYVDSTNNTASQSFIPKIIILRCFLTILVLSTPTVFPLEIYEVDNDGVFWDWDFVWPNRFWRNKTLVFLITFLILLTILKTTVIDYCIKKLGCQEDDELSMKLYNEDQGTYTEEKPHMFGLTTYNIFKNEKYSSTVKCIKEFINTKVKKVIKKVQKGKNKLKILNYPKEKQIGIGIGIGIDESDIGTIGTEISSIQDEGSLNNIRAEVDEIRQFKRKLSNYNL